MHCIQFLVVYYKAFKNSKFRNFTGALKKHLADLLIEMNYIRKKA